MPLKREGDQGADLSADAERMVTALRFANYSRIAEELGVTRSAVARWAKGRQVTPWNLSQVEGLLGQREEAAPPEWAERLMRTVDRIAAKLEVSEERAAIASAVEGLLSPPPDESDEDPPVDDPAGAERRGGPG